VKEVKGGSERGYGGGAVGGKGRRGEGGCEVVVGGCSRGRGSGGVHGE